MAGRVADISKEVGGFCSYKTLEALYDFNVYAE